MKSTRTIFIMLFAFAFFSIVDSQADSYKSKSIYGKKEQNFSASSKPETRVFKSPARMVDHSTSMNDAMKRKMRPEDFMPNKDLGANMAGSSGGGQSSGSGSGSSSDSGSGDSSEGPSNGGSSSTPNVVKAPKTPPAPVPVPYPNLGGSSINTGINSNGINSNGINSNGIR